MAAGQGTYSYYNGLVHAVQLQQLVSITNYMAYCKTKIIQCTNYKLHQHCTAAIGSFVVPVRVSLASQSNAESVIDQIVRLLTTLAS